MHLKIVKKIKIAWVIKNLKKIIIKNILYYFIHEQF